MAKSKPQPDLGSDAGDRFTVMRLLGNSKLALMMAERTRSLLSLTAVSGKPTIEKAGKPFDIWVSINTFSAEIPSVLRVFIIARFMVGRPCLNSIPVYTYALLICNVSFQQHAHVQ